MIHVPFGGISSIFRFLWRALRIKDGTHVFVSSVGERDETPRPKILVIGFEDSKETCFVQLPLLIKNEGLNPVKNLAARVELPKTLCADLHEKPPNSPTGEVIYKIDTYPSLVGINYELPTIRIDEGVVLPIMIRIRPSDWIALKVGDERKNKERFSKYGIDPITRLIGLRIDASVHADNIRAVHRRWDVWLTPSKDYEELQNRSTDLLTVKCIWDKGDRAFRFPFLWNIAYAPRLRMVPAAVVQLSSEKYAVSPEPGRLFEAFPGNEFIPSEFSDFVLANPGSEKADFDKWVKDIYDSKPPYYQ
ncbi:hypothetical protein [Methylocystis sp.]|uniref:hypothetical protein n=1 Tax=Methylocystis sp. TaxID=1911079 RepID=UPI003D0C664E